MLTSIKKVMHYFSVFLLLAVLLFAAGPGAAEKAPSLSEEDVASMGKDGQKSDVHGFLQEEGFATQEYVVQEGDWLTKILREKGLLEEYDTDELLEILRRLNDSLKNINVIQPGEKIVILVKVMSKEKEAREAPYHTYTVQPGDSLHKLATQRYHLSDKAFTRHYLPLLKRYNPGIKNLDRIHAGQEIRLPVYPPPAEAEPSIPPSIARDTDTRSRVTLADPKMVMRSFELDVPQATEFPVTRESKERPQKPVPLPEPKAPAAPVQVEEAGPEDQGMLFVLADDMGRMFTAMSEDWVDAGEHFIPMKSGGQIKLSTEKYPLLRLQQGTTVIVDLSSSLPRKMIKLIESTWPGYRVVAISVRDDLRTALGKILQACNYERIFKRGEPLELGGSVRIRVTADWIVVPPESHGTQGPRFMVISLAGPNTHPLPQSILDYLAFMGIEVIEYPPVHKGAPTVHPVKTAKAAKDTLSLIRSVLNITGLPHTTGHKVAAFSSPKDDFKLTIEADFYLKNRGSDAIIDLSGLDAKVVSLLHDRGVDVLSLSDETPLLAALQRLLKFLNVEHENGTHTFAAVPGQAITNVRVTVPGVVFRTLNGESVLATSASLPSEMVRFLSGKGYQVLVISESRAGRAQKG
ncbi:MAG: LysM peptidoglycan-binding domain-containing protein [Desulfobacteraceae bacterium]